MSKEYYGRQAAHMDAVTLKIIKRHDLKILSQYYRQQVSGVKNFELRKLDRDFKVGDELKLNEITETAAGEYSPTGRSCLVRITSILSDFDGLEKGYGILGTEMVCVK